MEIKNVSWSVKQLVTMSNKGTLLFDYPIQRSGGQWKPLQQAYLIHSLAQNYPIPPVYFLGEKREVTVMKKDEAVKEIMVVRYILDGKQRITSAKDFVEDQYALHKDTPEVVIEGETFELAGKRFSELDEEVQDMILSRNILTYTLDGEMVTDEEIEDLFFRMNNGSALTIQQKSKALMGVAWATKLKELGEHRLITELAAFSATQLKSDGHLTAILQAMMMIDPNYEDYKNVSQKVIAEYASTFKEDTEHKQELLSKVEKAMDYLLGVFDKKEKLLLKKVHFPMTLLTAMKAIEDDIDQEAFYGWAEAFKEAFKPKTGESITDVPTDYALYTGTGSTDKVKAVGRVEEMKRHMEHYTGLYHND